MTLAQQRGLAHRRPFLQGARVDLRRQPRPLTAMVGVPLGITAALLAGLWLAILPLTFCAWCWAPRDWSWNWFTALLTGFVGAEWAAVGAAALTAWPNHQIVIGLAWAGAAGCLALVAARRHRRTLGDRPR